MIDPWLLAAGLQLGLGAAAPIGPVNVEIVRRTLGHGRPAGIRLGLGAVSVDVACAAAVSLGLRPLAHSGALLAVLAVMGAAVLAWLGVMSLRAARARFRGGGDPVGASSSVGRHYRTGLLMTATNPMTLAFWFAAVPGTVAQLTDEPARDLPLVCAGVGAGALAWVLAFTSVVAWLGRRRPRWLFIAADAAGGLILLAFAGVVVWRFAAPVL